MSRDYNYQHRSVLFEECIEGLQIKPEGIYVDCTAGGGGHSKGIISRLGPEGVLISIDKDKDALEACKERMGSDNYPAQWHLVRSDFSCLSNILDQLKINKVDGVLADLGVSSYQLDQAERGFSYHVDGPLDMRMNPDQKKCAETVVNEYSEKELADIFYLYGEERFSRKIAQRIVEKRTIEQITTTAQLAEIVAQCMPSSSRREDQHPARRVFQAIRIEVNDELSAVNELLDIVPERLHPGGRFAVISFHSLEDRLVKERFKALEKKCTCPREFPVCVCNRKAMGVSVTRKPVIASQEELIKNSRSKSAKLRIFERNEEKWQP